jgi:hypothetical protein
MRFEMKAPLYRDHPEGIEDAKWIGLVGQVREAYAKNFEQIIGPMTAEAAAQSRKERKLYVGPWKSPGLPLPDSWI